jgi:hypothetical protein
MVDNTIDNNTDGKTVQKGAIMVGLEYMITFSTLVKNLMNRDSKAFEDPKVRDVIEDIVGPKNYVRMNEEYQHVLRDVVKTG